MKFPRHDAGLTLTHNENRGAYQTVEQYLVQCLDLHECPPEWPSGEREKAIATNEVWELQWHPDNPVGSYYVAASTLDALLAFANGDES